MIINHFLKYNKRRQRSQHKPIRHLSLKLLVRHVRHNNSQQQRVRTSRVASLLSRIKVKKSFRLILTPQFRPRHPPSLKRTLATSLIPNDRQPNQPIHHISQNHFRNLRSRHLSRVITGHTNHTKAKDVYRPFRPVDSRPSPPFQSHNPITTRLNHSLRIQLTHDTARRSPQPRHRHLQQQVPAHPTHRHLPLRLARLSHSHQSSYLTRRQLRPIRMFASSGPQLERAGSPSSRVS